MISPSSIDCEFMLISMTLLFELSYVNNSSCMYVKHDYLQVIKYLLLIFLLPVILLTLFSKYNFTSTILAQQKYIFKLSSKCIL